MRARSLELHGVANLLPSLSLVASHEKIASMDATVVAELERLDDGVPFRATTGHSHATWARTFHSSPSLYIRPQSEEEIQKITTLARRCRRRLATVGCGHSPSDITCTSSWLVNLDDYKQVLSVDKETGVAVMQAGIRLYQLGEVLETYGLDMPNLGSINAQSIAGAISTGTHGSTLRHGLMSESVLSLKMTLSNSRSISCSRTQNTELFRAAVLSLGCLGIITEITFQAVRAYSLHWQQEVWPDKHIFERWDNTLFQQSEYVRVWWFPYTRRAVVWNASVTERPASDLPFKPGYCDSPLHYYLYHNLLFISQYIPRILPWIEWFVFGVQHGFGVGERTRVEAIQPSRHALLMNCLYSQYVNEWAIPFEKGPIALRRLSSWLNQLQPTDSDYVEHGIPYDATGLWVHAPVEIRVTDSTIKSKATSQSDDARPFLDPTCDSGPTLYLNATLYRPYNLDPPCREQYYEAFEYLMKELGGKPHWAKNFTVTGEDIEMMYGEKLEQFRRIRNNADPDGMFVGDWHRRLILGKSPHLPTEEMQVERGPMKGEGGLHVRGAQLTPPPVSMLRYGSEKPGRLEALSGQLTTGPTSSEESFDMLHVGEGEGSRILSQ